MAGEFQGDPSWRRQKVLSVKNTLWDSLEAECKPMGFTVQEIARSILRAWVNGTPMPVRASDVKKAVDAVVTAPTPPQSLPPPPNPQPPRRVSAPLPAVAPGSSGVDATDFAGVPRVASNEDPDFDSPAERARVKAALTGVDENVPF